MVERLHMIHGAVTMVLRSGKQKQGDPIRSI